MYCSVRGIRVRESPGFRYSERKKKKKEMSFKKFDGVSVVTILLLLVLFAVCAAGGRELAEGNTQKDHYNAASKEGTRVLGSHPRSLMVKTNDYGRYDPAPAFSRPHFKPIPH